MTNNVRLRLVLVTLHWGLQVLLSKTIRIGDTQYNISVALFMLPLSKMIVLPPPPKVLCLKMFVGQSLWDTKTPGVGQSFWDGGSFKMKISQSFR